jgi:HSP90 family molecular chaperone
MLDLEHVSGRYSYDFYYAYLVADRVTVYSKHNDNEQFVRESTGDDGTFVVADVAGTPLTPGTRIILHMKERNGGIFGVKALVKEHYCEMIQFPIKLCFDAMVSCEESLCIS